MGLLVAIEGIDGSGKGTQAQRLAERLKSAGVRVALLSFPRYEATFFGRAAGAFLNGRFGTLDAVHPFLAALLFAGDRFESRTVLAEAQAAHEVVVLDRYVASNVAHQAAKADGSERDELCRSIEHVEYAVFGMPRPDLVVLLDLDVPAAQRLIAEKSPRTYTDRAADLQESDDGYLSRVRRLYLEIAKREPGSWSVVRCADEQGDVRPIAEIADEVWRIVSQRRAAGSSRSRDA